MAAKAERLGTELSCSICLDFFKDPVLLECGHHFCRACISQVWDRAAGDLSCPQCRQVFSQRNMKSNQLVDNIVEIFREMDFSTETASSQSEKQDQVEGKELYCTEHEEKLKLFCEEDDKAICVICGMSRNHKTHNLMSITEAVEIYKEKLEGSLQALQNHLKQASESLIQEVKERKTLQAKTASLRKQIEEEFSKLHQYLEEEEKNLKAKLEEEEKKHLETLKKSQEAITKEVSRLKRTVTEIEGCLQYNSVEMLAGIKAVLAKTETEFQKPQKPCVDLCEGEFIGPLQYRVWKRMKSIISPVPESVAIDTKTAHRRLIVSEDRSSVQFSDEYQGVPDNLERFINRFAALGPEGLTSGRHYWEVKVGDTRFWSLGVVRESVERKKTTVPSPVNGFYLLCKNFSFGVYYARWANLPLTVEPRKIGVYVDYEGGQVSFYNADNMSHIYTYTDTFTERMYPYFRTFSDGAKLMIQKL
ncbi:E3 ubiquitin-protein ligase TRIM39-like [Latimeria chalumnae]|uniref:E3 ubiquitin-protein ligase TRIM39-like n=1 Tax=Latimeria chalumnae TaxID=7897 RepID=UPI0003C13501|nr:PREDICTED: E3 ubiquitin-protein ligase TRIM39-like [Latimeria chalumnae]|eukprot:XP_006013775.1 PREDICTED: E3 ubiquitin-protein ligase TRIM39-like [Latimeria chalumnae]